MYSLELSNEYAGAGHLFGQSLNAHWIMWARSNHNIEILFALTAIICKHIYPKESALIAFSLHCFYKKNSLKFLIILTQVCYFQCFFFVFLGLKQRKDGKPKAIWDSCDIHTSWNVFKKMSKDLAYW